MISSNVVVTGLPRQSMQTQDCLLSGVISLYFMMYPTSDYDT
jgi:hypothetical protein